MPKGIVENNKVLNTNARLMWAALIVAGLSVLTGIGVTTGLALSGCL
jgi:hypothetical protein